MINPEQKTDILSSRLIQLNTEYTNAKATAFAKSPHTKQCKAVPWQRLKFRRKPKN